jgi:hypothetical protein
MLYYKQIQKRMNFVHYYFVDKGDYLKIINTIAICNSIYHLLSKNRLGVLLLLFDCYKL